MSQLRSLDTLIDLATEQRDAAAVTLGRLHGDRAEVQAQLDALYSYRDEYRQQLENAMRAGLSMTCLENYKQFLTALDAAIEQQRNHLEHSDARLDQGRHEWQSRQKKLKSFDTLAQRRQTALDRHETQREQNQIDDYANQTHRYHRL